MTGELQHKLAQLPDKPGCYVYRDAAGVVLYVGKAEVLKNRVRSYFQEGADHHPRTALMVSRVADLEVMVTDSPVEALLLEHSLIKRHKPLYNVRLRDDKHYPYICLTMNEAFPRPIVVRRAKRDGNRYFGPYTSSWAMRQALRVIKAVFQLRGCSRKIAVGDQQKLCLEYHLKLCSGPCASLIEQSEYRRAVDEVAQFLEGKADLALKRLHEDMERAADSLNFEMAARVRDQIRAIERVTERQKIFSTDLEDQDAIALVSDSYQTCACVLQIREGRLQGQDLLFLEGAHPDELPEATRQFLEQYYSRNQYTGRVPRQILVAHEVQDRAVLEEWLTGLRSGWGSTHSLSHSLSLSPADPADRTNPPEEEKEKEKEKDTGAGGRRRRVHLLVPQRGEKRRLVEMAEKNARQQLEERRTQQAADQARGEEAVLDLAEKLELDTLPYRIECYDISNTMGQESVGAMVVFEGGQAKKADYRKFKIKTVEGPNDFASMQEVLRRRLQRGIEGDAKFSEMPDLIVIDGGKGQLNAALEVERELDVEIPTIGLAKRLEEVFRPGERDSVLLPRNSQGLFLLQRLRDEAHRFGLTYHRNLRGKKQTRSALDAIPGIGDKRRKALLKHFGSVDKMKQASVEELAGAPGMTRPAAAQLHRSLHPEPEALPKAA